MEKMKTTVTGDFKNQLNAGTYHATSVSSGFNPTFNFNVQKKQTVYQKGMQGEEIKAVQILLQKRGFSVGAKGIDGKFGTDTETAVRAFQAKMGLWVDGKVGGETYFALVTGKIKVGSRLRDGSYAGQNAGKPKTSGTIKPIQQPTSHGGTSTLSMPEADDDGSMWLWGGLGALAAWFWWKRRKRKKRK